MGAVTYPDPTVSTFLAHHFTCVRIDIGAPRPEARQLLRLAKPLWGPLFVWLDASRVELRRTYGWLPPDEFLAELRFVLATQAFLRRDFQRALDGFVEIVDRSAAAHAAPEACYWAGVAAYRRAGNRLAALEPLWQELVQRYPGSTWAQRAAVLPSTLAAAGGPRVEP
jgi:hypothetical protein